MVDRKETLVRIYYEDKYLNYYKRIKTLEEKGNEKILNVLDKQGEAVFNINKEKKAYTYIVNDNNATRVHSLFPICSNIEIYDFYVDLDDVISFTYGNGVWKDEKIAYKIFSATKKGKSKEIKFEELCYLTDDKNGSPAIAINEKIEKNDVVIGSKIFKRKDISHVKKFIEERIGKWKFDNTINGIYDFFLKMVGKSDEIYHDMKGKIEEFCNNIPNLSSKVVDDNYFSGNFDEDKLKKISFFLENINIITLYLISNLYEQSKKELGLPDVSCERPISKNETLSIEDIKNYIEEGEKLPKNIKYYDYYANDWIKKYLSSIIKSISPEKGGDITKQSTEQNNAKINKLKEKIVKLYEFKEKFNLDSEKCDFLVKSINNLESNTNIYKNILKIVEKISSNKIEEKKVDINNFDNYEIHRINSKYYSDFNNFKKLFLEGFRYNRRYNINIPGIPNGTFEYDINDEKLYAVFPIYNEGKFINTYINEKVSLEIEEIHCHYNKLTDLEKKIFLYETFQIDDYVLDLNNIQEKNDYDKVYLTENDKYLKDFFDVYAKSVVKKLNNKKEIEQEFQLIEKLDKPSQLKICFYIYSEIKNNNNKTELLNKCYEKINNLIKEENAKINNLIEGEKIEEIYGVVEEKIIFDYIEFLIDKVVDKGLEYDDFKTIVSKLIIIYKCKSKYKLEKENIEILKKISEKNNTEKYKKIYESIFNEIIDSIDDCANYIYSHGNAYNNFLISINNIYLICKIKYFNKLEEKEKIKLINSIYYSFGLINGKDKEFEFDDKKNGYYEAIKEILVSLDENQDIIEGLIDKIIKDENDGIPKIGRCNNIIDFIKKKSKELIEDNILEKKEILQEYLKILRYFIAYDQKNQYIENKSIYSVNYCGKINRYIDYKKIIDCLEEISLVIHKIHEIGEEENKVDSGIGEEIKKSYKSIYELLLTSYFHNEYSEIEKGFNPIDSYRDIFGEFLNKSIFNQKDLLDFLNKLFGLNTEDGTDEKKIKNIINRFKIYSTFKEFNDIKDSNENSNKLKKMDEEIKKDKEKLKKDKTLYEKLLKHLENIKDEAIKKELLEHFKYKEEPVIIEKEKQINEIKKEEIKINDIQQNIENGVDDDTPSHNKEKEIKKVDNEKKDELKDKSDKKKKKKESKKEEKEEKVEKVEKENWLKTWIKEKFSSLFGKKKDPVLLGDKGISDIKIDDKESNSKNKKLKKSLKNESKEEFKSFEIKKEEKEKDKKITKKIQEEYKITKDSQDIEKESEKHQKKESDVSEQQKEKQDEEMMKNKENYYYDLPEKEIEVESIKNTEITAKKEMIIEKIKEYIFKEYISSSDIIEKEEIKESKDTEETEKLKNIRQYIVNYVAVDYVASKEKENKVIRENTENIKEKNKEIIEKYLGYNNNTEDFKEIINDDFGKQCLKEEAKFTACAFNKKYESGKKCELNIGFKDDGIELVISGYFEKDIKIFNNIYTVAEILKKLANCLENGEITENDCNKTITFDKTSGKICKNPHKKFSDYLERDYCRKKIDARNTERSY